MTEFPLEISEFSEEDKREFEEAAVYKTVTFVKVGPKGFTLPSIVRKYGPSIYNFKAGPGDVILNGFNSSGTYLGQELTWALFNGVDGSEERILFQRVPLIETRFIIDTEEGLIRGVPNSRVQEIWEDILGSAGGRIIKTDLLFSLYGRSNFLESGAKFIYVIRDPKAVIAGVFTNYRRIAVLKPRAEFGDFWRLFKNNHSIYTPFFEAIKEAWELRHSQNFLLVSHKELTQETANAIQRVSGFLGKAVDKDEANAIEEYLKKKEESEVPVGTWKKLFKDGLEDDVQKWIENNLELHSLPRDIFEAVSFDSY